VKISLEGVFTMALFKKQDKKNEKEEKNLQTLENKGKVSLDDDLLESVSGGYETHGDRPILGPKKL
jgi:hypothetical protein